MKDFWTFFFLQVVSYCLIDASYRFISQANVPLSVSTAMLYAGLAFFVIRKVGEARAKSAVYGYILGGGVGTFLGIVVSKAITGI